jgi:uncharacterized protein
MHGIIWAMVGWGLGGFVNGYLGFGAALMAMPVVVLGNDMAVALPASSLLILALNLQMAWNYRRHIARAPAWLMLAGALPGAAGGLILLRFVSESGLKVGLGLLLLACAGWGLCSKYARRGGLGPVWGVLAGFLSTCFGTAFGINGPPPAAYMSLRGGSQSEIKGALGFFFIWSTACIVAAQALAGMFSLRAVTVAGAGLPAMLVCALGGMRLSARLGTAAFHRAMSALLLIMGCNIIWTGLS